MLSNSFLNNKTTFFASGAAGVSAAVHREHQAQGGVGQPQDHGKPQEIPGTSTGNLSLKGQSQKSMANQRKYLELQQVIP